MLIVADSNLLDSELESLAFSLNLIVSQVGVLINLAQNANSRIISGLVFMIRCINMEVLFLQITSLYVTPVEKNSKNTIKLSNPYVLSPMCGCIPFFFILV